MGNSANRVVENNSANDKDTMGDDRVEYQNKLYSVHDQIVCGYEVNLRDNRVSLQMCSYEAYGDPQNTDKDKSKVFKDGLEFVFTGVLAHHFQYQVEGSVILALEEIGLEAFIHQYGNLFEEGLAYGWALRC